MQFIPSTMAAAAGLSPLQLQVSLDQREPRTRIIIQFPGSYRQTSPTLNRIYRKDKRERGERGGEVALRRRSGVGQASLGCSLGVAQMQRRCSSGVAQVCRWPHSGNTALMEQYTC